MIRARTELVATQMAPRGAFMQELLGALEAAVSTCNEVAAYGASDGGDAVTVELLLDSTNYGHAESLLDDVATAVAEALPDAYAIERTFTELNLAA